MKFPFFGRKKPVSKDEPITIPALSFDEDTNAENYIADDGLKTAINLALLMGKPLLITGEPGTGKTQFAYRLGWELGATLLTLENVAVRGFRFSLARFFKACHILT